MRKTLSVCAAKLSRALALAAVVCASTATASAAETVDLGALKLDTDYSVEAKKSWTATFTAPESGELKIIDVSGTNAYVSAIYTDAAYTEAVYGNFSGYTTNPKYYAYNVVAGTTYYLHAGGEWGLMSNGTFRLEMTNSAKFNIQSVKPAEGNVLSITNGYPYIDILFDAKVGKISGCTFECNGTSKKIVAAPINHILQISYEAAVQAMYDANAPEGSDITITITGLTNKGGALYNGDGTLVLNYKLGKAPVRLVTDQLPAIFKSYWPAGDKEGVATFTFSGDLSTALPADAVTLTFGSVEVEGNEYYLANVPFTVAGNVLTADLSGVRRTPADMVASGINYNNMTIQLNGIKAADGDYVYSAGQGSIGSFAYLWEKGKYLVMEKGQISADFTPANGTSLKNANQIEVWMQGADVIRFDGFTLTAEDNGEVTTVNVPMSAVTVAKDSEGTTYTFNIPAEIKGKNGVTVTLTNVVSIDGYDHADDVKANYDTFVVTSCDPMNGTEMVMLEAGKVITITTNYSADYPELWVMYEITDLNATDPDQAVVKALTWLNRQEDGSYTATINGAGIELLKGHKYEVRFTAWESEMDKNYGASPLGAAKVYWYGLCEPFTFSDIKFVGANPAPSENFFLSPEQNSVILTFDGGVTLDSASTFINTGMGTTSAFESIETVNGGYEFDGKTYNNEWKLTVSASWLKSWDSNVMMSIKAYDENGKIVEGNTGHEEGSHILLDYQTENEYRDFVLSPAAGTEAEELSRFTASFEAGIGLSYSGAKAYLQGMDRTVYSLTASTPEGDQTTTNTEVYLDLAEPITKPGIYTLIVEPGYFILGTEITFWKSKGVEVNYYVKEKEITGDDNRALTPDPADKNIKSLSQITIAYPDYTEVGIGAGKATLTIGAARKTITLPDAEYGIEYNEAIQPLGQTYTEKGTYTVNFPEGYFLLGSDGENSAAFAAVYTIGDSVGVEFVAADENGVYNVFNMAGVKVMTTADAADFTTLPAGIYIINGKKIAIR